MAPSGGKGGRSGGRGGRRSSTVRNSIASTPALDTYAGPTATDIASDSVEPIQALTTPVSATMGTPSGSSEPINASTAPSSTSDTPSSSTVRGTTCGRGTQAMKKAAKGRLTVDFNFTLMQAICDNAERFNNEIGYIVRTHCSFQYKEWRLVPPHIRAPLRDRLL
ncbi:hypothetical protein TorRG33x02_357480, partial [Trema orientale]